MTRDLMTILQVGAPIGAPNLLILGAAAIGLIVNTLVVLGVAWKGGHLLGRMDSAIERLSLEVERLRQTRDDHSSVIARTIQQLDDIERRVTRLES